MHAFFEKGIENLNWKSVEEKIKQTIQQFYLMDLSQFAPEIIRPLLDDFYFCGAIKDQKMTHILGYLLAALIPAMPYGIIKIISVAVTPEKQKRGLELLLLSVLFKILPEVKHLFIFTRTTNGKMIQSYEDMGFARSLKPIEDPHHKINMEFAVLLE